LTSSERSQSEQARRRFESAAATFEYSYPLVLCKDGSQNSNAVTACRIADFIETGLQLMKPEQRVLYDLTITDKPKKPVIITPSSKTDEIDAIDVYSASYEWLIKFRDFSRTSGGFEVC
jgi:hypothetical protein